VLNGRYRLVRVLGAGTFGRVYLAEDTQDRGSPPVAVKELLTAHFSSPDDQHEAITWFKREVSTLLTLEHAGIPAIVGYWTAHTTSGPFYLAMEYILGQTLDETLQDAGGHVPWPQVLAGRWEGPHSSTGARLRVGRPGTRVWYAARRFTSVRHDVSPGRAPRARRRPSPQHTARRVRAPLIEGKEHASASHTALYKVDGASSGSRERTLSSVHAQRRVCSRCAPRTWLWLNPSWSMRSIDYMATSFGTAGAARAAWNGGTAFIDFFWADEKDKPSLAAVPGRYSTRAGICYIFPNSRAGMPDILVVGVVGNVMRRGEGKRAYSPRRCHVLG
jgi:hypothetical protein